MKPPPLEIRSPFHPSLSLNWFNLVEKNRLPLFAYEELTQALADPEHVFTEAVFTAAIVQSMRQVPRAEVPHMPDRIIAATAVYFEVPVLSRDRRILSAGLKTVW